MLKFSTLDERLDLLKKYLPYSTTNFCEFSLGVKYMWRKDVITEFAEYEDTLILKNSTDSYKNAFYFPFGKNVEGALEQIEEYCLKTNTPLSFCSLDETQKQIIQARYSFTETSFDRNWSDYIYDAEKFKAFTGKKYSGQRNHINKFKKLYPTAEFKVATKDDLPKMCQYVKDTTERLVFSMWSEKAEAENLMDFVVNAFELEQLCGLVWYEGEIIGLSIGEIVNDVLIVHVEKANKAFEGVYPFLANSFAKAFANGVTLINREEDCGDLGLRTSKTQYQPIEIKPKNFVKVKKAIAKIPDSVSLSTERLTVTAILEQDKADYCALYLDEKLNEFWGYDYKADLGDDAPTPEYFFQFQKTLKENQEEFDFAVRKDGKMIGEIALYNFDYAFGAEIGFRLTEQAQGKGYAFESVSAVIDYFFNALDGKTLKVRCYKQNLKSKRLIERLGFTISSQSETHFFFQLDK